MKKIMKKVLSLVLVLALAIVPMTVMAAEGDPVATPPYSNCIYSGDTVAVEAGATTYFEVGTNGAAGTYDFIVEGTGDFAVAVCTEGSSEAYAEGTPVSAVNGKVETTITSYESTYGYAAFSITNNTNASVNYTCTVVFPEGTQGNPKAVTLAVGGTVQVTVPAQTQYYVAATLPAMNTDYQLTITGNTGFGMPAGWVTTWDTNGVLTTTVQAYMPTANLSIINNTENEQTYTLALDNIPIGAQTNPATLVLGDGTNVLENNAYWYTWTATEAGTFTLTMDNAECANGWTYNIIDANNISYNFSTAWGESDKNVCNVQVANGDVIKLGVWVPKYLAEYDAYDASVPGSGAVVFTTAFVTGDSNPDGGDGGSGDGGSGSGGDAATGTEINANYYFSYQELTTGTNEIMAQFGYPTTLYTFVPTEAGEYKVTINDQSALLGYFGSNEWFPFDYTETKTYELTLDATQANAPMLIGVSNALNAIITITRSGDAQGSQSLPVNVYENKVTPTKQDLKLDASKLEGVDVWDDTKDKAVLGKDGYYHLNKEDGPVLFVNLTDSILSLADFASYGAKEGVYDNGTVVSMNDYTKAILDYVACATQLDDKTNVYPLTEDLMTFYQKLGAYKYWYEADPVMGTQPVVQDAKYPEDEAWMFACYYQEGLNSIGGSTSGGTSGGTSTGTTTGTTNTGDNANVAVWAIVMVVAAGAAFVVAESKRRAR